MALLNDANTAARKLHLFIDIDDLIAARSHSVWFNGSATHSGPDVNSGWVYI